MYLEIDLDDVFVEAGQGFGPPGFETEPPPIAQQPFGCRYSQRLPLLCGRHTPRLAEGAVVVTVMLERRD